MSKSNAFETALLGLLFENTAIANLGDAGGLRASATAGSLYFSLHTADPGEAGDQTTSECTYTSYARVAVARSSAGFTVTGNTIAVDADVVFPQALVDRVPLPIGASVRCHRVRACCCIRARSVPPSPRAAVSRHA